MSFTSAASVLAAPLDTGTWTSFDSEARKAATSWQTVAFLVALADPDDDAAADDDAPPELVPLDAHALTSSPAATRVATIRHHASVPAANRLIATLTVCQALGSLSLLTQRPWHIVRAG
jgi:hypothetical protein